MGRTLPTIVQTLEGEKDRWKLFRRALRKADQEAFDLLWRDARRQAAPASMASRALPMEAFAMAMGIGLARRLLDLEKRIEELERGLSQEGGGDV